MNIVDNLVRDGWYLEAVKSAIPKRSVEPQTRYYLVPPDHRKSWAAEWSTVNYGVFEILVPHWAMNTRGQPPPGMPQRFGRKTFL